MSKYTYYAIFVASVAVIGSAWLLHQVDTDVVVVNETRPTPTLNDTIVDRTLAIMDSPEFQNEMRAKATARAMFELSIENQEVALWLSEMAQESYKNSEVMANDWHEKAKKE